jgi:transcriptional regulator with XRE-family HTH domain
MYTQATMVIPGEIDKEGGHYGAMLEVIGAYGQGRTRRAACDSLAQAIRDFAAYYGPLDGFDVQITDDGEATLYVTANDPVRMVALLLRHQRELHELSLADVAKEMGNKSRNGFAQYESGRSEPSITKLQELLNAVAPELMVSIIPRTARVIPRWDEEMENAAEIDAVMRDPSPANIAALVKAATRSATARRSASSPTRTSAKRTG